MKFNNNFTKEDMMFLLDVAGGDFFQSVKYIEDDENYLHLDAYNGETFMGTVLCNIDECKILSSDDKVIKTIQTKLDESEPDYNESLTIYATSLLVELAIYVYQRQ